MHEVERTRRFNRQNAEVDIQADTLRTVTTDSARKPSAAHKCGRRRSGRVDRPKAVDGNEPNEGIVPDALDSGRAHVDRTEGDDDGAITRTPIALLTHRRG